MGGGRDVESNEVRQKLFNNNPAKREIFRKRCMCDMRKTKEIFTCADFRIKYVFGVFGFVFSRTRRSWINPGFLVIVLSRKRFSFGGPGLALFVFAIVCRIVFFSSGGRG